MQYWISRLEVTIAWRASGPSLHEPVFEVAPENSTKIPGQFFQRTDLRKFVTGNDCWEQKRLDSALYSWSEVCVVTSMQLYPLLIYFKYSMLHKTNTKRKTEGICTLSPPSPSLMFIIQKKGGGDKSTRIKCFCPLSPPKCFVKEVHSDKYWRYCPDAFSTVLPAMSYGSETWKRKRIIYCLIFKPLLWISGWIMLPQGPGCHKLSLWHFDGITTVFAFVIQSQAMPEDATWIVD